MMSSWTYRGRPVVGACASRSVSRLGAGEVTDLAAGTARGPGDHYLAASPLLICGDVDHSKVMRESHRATAGEEIRQMQDGIRDWVRRATRRGEGELRKIPPPVLLSLLCASAFCPLLVGVGVAGPPAGAGLGVLSSVGGGVLSTVLADAVDRLRRSGKPGLSKQDLEDGVAQQIQSALAAGDEHAEELRSEIAAVFERIDAGETLLQAAIDAGNERVHGDVIAVIEL